MLATVAYLMRGTPFIYQGEEIGMTNVGFERLEQFRDVEVLGNVAGWSAAGKTLEEILASARAVCRDNARTPMQWSDAAHAGFTSGTPWIEVNGNHREINVAADAADPDGMMAHYRRLIALRRELDIVSHGRFVAHAEDHPAVVAYCRETDDEVSPWWRTSPARTSPSRCRRAWRSPARACFRRSASATGWPVPSRSRHTSFAVLGPRSPA